MNLEQALEWAHRAEPAEVFIASHPRRTQDALWKLVEEIERLTVELEAKTAAEKGWCNDWAVAEAELSQMRGKVALLELAANAPDNDWQLIAKGFEMDRTEIMRKVATDCTQILMENVNDHGYQFGCEEAFVAIKKKFGLAL